MKLYVYDHCPYCVKARTIFGIKNVPFELVVLQNDDEETPTKMIGKKMVPILEKDDGSYMGESMDIVKYIDENFGESRSINNGIDNRFHNEALREWEGKIRQYVYKLAMPRWVDANLEEFHSQSAKDYFTSKKEVMLGAKFSELLRGSAEFISAANLLLEELDKILTPSGKVMDFGKLEFVNGELTEDDIHLFAYLRSLTIVDGIKFPDKIKKFAANFSSKSKVPLHFGIAI